MTEPHVIRMLPNSDIVRAMVRRGGGCDAKEFIQSLDRRFQARYQRYLEYLRDGVSIKTPENFRRLSPHGAEPIVFEIKVDKYRLYIVRFQMNWYATHGRAKPKDNQVPREIQKALEIFWEGNGGIS